MRPIDQWYLDHDETTRACLQFLRRHILAKNTSISEAWKYKMPFFVLMEKCAATYGCIKNTDSHTLALWRAPA